MEGFKGFVALGSRQSGKLEGVAFWENEKALRATTKWSHVRRGWRRPPAGTVASVEEYEVFVNEAPQRGRWARSRAR